MQDTRRIFLQNLRLIWQAIEARKLAEAARRLENLKASCEQASDEIHARTQVATGGLASAYHSRSKATGQRNRRYARAVEDYHSALRFDPNCLPALNDLAWLLATCPRAEFRNGTEAVNLAKQACELTDWNDEHYINTLAAAHAEAGDFEAATKWQKQAIDLLPYDKHASLQRDYEYRLKQYKSCKPYQRGMVGWWKFDGDATDASGHEFHGTKIGNPTYVMGVLGQAISLRGDGDHILAPDLGFYLNGLDELTVCLWVKANATGMDRGFIIFEEPAGAKHSFGGNDNRDMRYDAAGGDGGGTDLIKCGITSHVTSGAVPYNQQLESSSNVQATEWQHLAMAWSNADQLRLYINSVEDIPAWRRSKESGRLTGYTKLIIGKGGKDIKSDQSWAGLIDDVRIYNYALSEREIRELYESAESSGTK
jgi:tetratricopeptide (TPR) repeat protein